MRVSEIVAPGDFNGFVALLCGELEVFLYPVTDLAERWGDRYRQDALYILDRLAAFAHGQGESLGDALRFYRSHVDQVALDRRRFLDEGVWPDPAAPEDEKAHRQYLYALTLSTVLNRSRYELFLNYRRAVKKYMKPGALVLEIGAGNCLDAAFASACAKVEAYEKNPLSRVWRCLVDPEGRIDLHLEECRFERASACDWVTMIELLEHLPDPSAYLQGASRVLRDDGLAYLTFALRMPQHDHLWLFESVQECRDLLAENRFRVLRDDCLIDSCLPFRGDERWHLADHPAHPAIYCCLAQKHGGEPRSVSLEDFNAALED